MNTQLHRSLSYWEVDTFFRKTDILIIGAGIVGINAALRIKRARPSWKIKVIDRGGIPAGASTRNAGFACFGSPTEILDDLLLQSENEVFETVERRYRGLLALKQELSLDVLQYEACGGSEVFSAEDTETYERCLDHLSFLNQRVQPITGLPETYLPDPRLLAKQGMPGFSHLIQNQAEGGIHPGSMMQALLQKAQSAGVDFLFGTAIETIKVEKEGVRVKTANFGEMFVERVLVANNGFSRHLLPELKVQGVRNQVWVTEPIPGLSIRGCFHYDRGYFYFRNIGNRLLIGGGRHLDRAGESTTEFGESPVIQSALRDLLQLRILPKKMGVPNIDFQWSGILGVGEGKAPIIRKLDDRLVVAVRLGGMGVAIGTLVGQDAGKLMVQS
ncbi:MAG: FAD-dependent oxidoreductase [Bacteroidota bacterium]